MKLRKLRLLLSSTLVFSTVFTVQAIGQTIDPGDTMIRLPKAPKKEARVRLGVQIVPYKELTVTNQQGKLVHRQVKVKAIARNIRAQISRTNHFYIGDWHIETVPESWDKDTMQIKYKMNLYKQYGTQRQLEEFVGATTALGTLKGKDFVYAFHGQGASQFRNRRQKIVADLRVGPPIGMRKVGNISRAADTRKKQ